MGSVVAERNDGRVYIDIDVDWDKARKWGVRSADIQDNISMAIGGKT
jgi:Cu/Ag efflux pump CusA